MGLLQEAGRYTQDAFRVAESPEWNITIDALSESSRIEIRQYSKDTDVFVFIDQETKELTAPFLDGKLKNVHGFYIPNPDQNWVQERQKVARISAEISGETGIETINLSPLTKVVLSQLQKAIAEHLHELTDEKPEMQREEDSDAALDFIKTLLVDSGVVLRTVDVNQYDLATKNGWTPLPSHVHVFTDESGSLVGLNMYGHSPHGKFEPTKINPPMKPTVYQNVTGFVTIPAETSLRDRKIISRYAANQIKRITHRTNINILTVDENLVKTWTEIGQPWPADEDVEGFTKKPAKKRVDYGGIVQDFTPRVFVTFHEPNHSHIGGTQIKVITQVGNHVFYSVLLDKGWIFDQVPAWSGIGKTPTYTEGLTPFLTQGMFDTSYENLRLFRSDLLLQSITPNLLSRAYQETQTHLGNKSFPFSLFTLLEVTHRFGPEFLDFYVRQQFPKYYKSLQDNNLTKPMWNAFEARELEVYMMKIIHTVLALTHAHQDHAIGSSLVRDSIMRLWTPETMSLLLNDHLISSSWYIQDTAIRKMRERPELKEGSAYATFAYPNYLIHDGETIEVAPNIFLTAIKVDHSIPGSVGYLLEIKDRKGRVINSIAYPGDYRDTNFFTEIGKRGGVDLLMIEGTNSPHTHKESALFTEEHVAQNFRQLLSQANAHDEGALVIVDMIKNSFGRLKSFLETTRNQGRIPVISPRMALAVHLVTQNLRLYGAVDTNIPYLPDYDIRIWEKPASTYKQFERDLCAAFGKVTQDELSANPKGYVLFRDNSESPYKLEGISAPKVIWVQSTYAAYDYYAKIEKNYRKAFAKLQGWEYRDYGFHASGHVRLLSPDHPESNKGILANIHKAKPKSLVVIHTQKREIVSDLVREYPENRNIKIYERLQHPRHKIALKGRYLR